MKGCAGKRHYATKRKALRGLRNLLRDNRDTPDPRGRLSVYECECGLWCIRRGYEGRPSHKQAAQLDPCDFGKGAEVWRQATAIAAERYPNGGNVSQLAQVLREVLAQPAEGRDA